MAAGTSRAARVAKAKKPKIKIGQIGTGHAHARGVFAQLKQVTDDFELVGIVENDPARRKAIGRSEEHTSELQSLVNLVCRLLLEKKKT